MLKMEVWTFLEINALSKLYLPFNIDRTISTCLDSQSEFCATDEKTAESLCRTALLKDRKKQERKDTNLRLFKSKAFL